MVDVVNEADIVGFPQLVLAIPNAFLNCFLTMASSKEWNFIVAASWVRISMVGYHSFDGRVHHYILTLGTLRRRGFFRVSGGFPSLTSSSGFVGFIRRSQTLWLRVFDASPSRGRCGQIFRPIVGGVNRSRRQRRRRRRRRRRRCSITSTTHPHI